MIGGKPLGVNAKTRRAKQMDDKKLREKIGGILRERSAYPLAYPLFESVDQILALLQQRVEEAVIQARKEQMVLDWAQARKDVEEAREREGERMCKLLRIPPADSSYCLSCCLLEAGTSCAYDQCNLYSVRLKIDRNGHRKCRECLGQALKGGENE